jgi:hypothetical protein
MRQRDKVLDDLRNVQSRDRTSLKKASVSSLRTAQRIRTKVAKRKRPYGAKKMPPIEMPFETPAPPFPRDYTSTDTSTIGHVTVYDRNYQVLYSSTCGSDCSNGTATTGNW